MKINNHLLLCNGADGKRPNVWETATKQSLATFGASKNVRLKITDLTNRMAAKLPERVHDLVEIAALVYAADQSCKRLAGMKFDYGDLWHRVFRFEIAVRDSTFWSRPDVSGCLSETLSFLSDDDYEFVFRKMTHPPPFADYLDFNVNDPEPEPVNRVVLFSGGLDSLAGVVDEILVKKRRVVLVSHKPVDHLAKKQRDLISEITKRSKDQELRPVHFPILANRMGDAEGDHTQRSRSFLYAAFAAAVAGYFNLDDVYFYENGIVSINLPLCSQEIGGKATRTTHPYVLRGFSQLFKLVFQRPFKVHNNFLWDTKEDVLTRLDKAGHVDLAQNTLSCSHTRMYTHPSPHCGECSQCLSRRVAALGAGYGDNDRASGYRNDVVLGERRKDSDRILAERFVGCARIVEGLHNVNEFHNKFSGELGRVYPSLDLSASLGAEKLYDLHSRHAVQVGKVMLSVMKQFSEQRRMGKLPVTSVANYAFDSGGASPRTTAVSGADDAEQLLKDLKLLNEREMNCIQALYEKNIIGPNAENKPSQKILSKLTGYACDTQFKTMLSTLVKARYLDNSGRSGTAGGYYLTLRGERAGEIYFQQS